MTCEKWIEHNSIESIQIVVLLTCKKKNRSIVILKFEKEIIQQHK